MDIVGGDDVDHACQVGPPANAAEPSSEAKTRTDAKSIPKREDASLRCLGTYRLLRNSSNGWPDLHSYDEGGSVAAVPWHLPVASVTLLWRIMRRRFSRLLPHTCGTPPARVAPGEYVWVKGS